MERKYRRRRILAVIIGLIVGTNFFVFAGTSVHLGGFPNYEKSVGGRYYLSDHGIHTEVSEQIFTFMEWYSIISWGLLIIFPLLLVIKELFTRFREFLW